MICPLLSLIAEPAKNRKFVEDLQELAADLEKASRRTNSLKRKSDIGHFSKVEWSCIKKKRGTTAKLHVLASPKRLQFFLLTTELADVI